MDPDTSVWSDGKNIDILVSGSFSECLTMNLKKCFLRLSSANPQQKDTYNNMSFNSHACLFVKPYLDS